MADHTITINNSLRTLGIGPTSKWGTMVWGTDKWGDGSIPVQAIKFTAIAISNSVNATVEIIKHVTKGIFNTQATTSDVVKIPYKLISNAVSSDSAIPIKNPTKVLTVDSTVTSDITKEASISFSNSIAATEDLGSIKIFDNAGFIDEFPGGIPDGLNRIWDNWTESSQNSDVSSQSSDPTTTWSEA